MNREDRLYGWSCVTGEVEYRRKFSPVFLREVPPLNKLVGVWVWRSSAVPRALVVDDEPVVRATLVRMLERLGHEVESCADGASAVGAYAEARRQVRPFGVVITDLVMPGGMGGHETARAILQLDPEARIIVSSGYSADTVMADHSGFGFAAALEKPYTLDTLAAVVASVVET
jgi:CheY-like chemotaxis protein